MCLAVQLTEHNPNCDCGVDCECKPAKSHSYSSLFRKFTNGLMKRVTSAVKPLLTVGNEVVRVNWVLVFVFIDYNSGVSFEPKIDAMYDIVHIDE